MQLLMLHNSVGNTWTVDAKQAANGAMLRLGLEPRVPSLQHAADHLV